MGGSGHAERALKATQPEIEISMLRPCNKKDDTSKSMAKAGFIDTGAGSPTVSAAGEEGDFDVHKKAGSMAVLPENTTR